MRTSVQWISCAFYLICLPTLSRSLHPLIPFNGYPWRIISYQISTMKCVNKLNSLVDDIVLVCCYQIWTIDTTGCVHSWQNLWTYCQRLSLTQYLFNLPSVADIICWIKFSNLLSSVIHMVVFVCLSAHIPVIYSRSFMYIYVYETFVCWLWPRFIFDRKTSNVC